VITFTFTIRNDGTAQAHGFALLQDGGMTGGGEGVDGSGDNSRGPGGTLIPSRILLLESGATSAACADTDGDGVAGLTGVEVAFGDVRSGEVVFASIAPHAGEIDESGRHAVTLRIDDESLNGEALVRLFNQPDPPGLMK
jgi:hypothetical protein